jgi:hypothetical protein
MSERMSSPISKDINVIAGSSSSPSPLNPVRPLRGRAHSFLAVSQPTTPQMDHRLG